MGKRRTTNIEISPGGEFRRRYEKGAHSLTASQVGSDRLLCDSNTVQAHVRDHCRAEKVKNRKSNAQNNARELFYYYVCGIVKFGELMSQCDVNKSEKRKMKRKRNIFSENMRETCGIPFTDGLLR